MILTKKEFTELIKDEEELEFHSQVVDDEDKYGIKCGKYIFWIEDSRVEDVVATRDKLVAEKEKIREFGGTLSLSKNKTEIIKNFDLILGMDSFDENKEENKK